MFDYQLGGNAAKVDASEGIADIPMNRSMFVQKLTANDPVKPQAVYGLENVKSVFEHFKPQVKVDFEKQDGSTTSEEIRFTEVGDFKPNAMVNQSPFLQSLKSEKEDYQKLVKQLKTNKLVKNVIENPETKAAFMSALQALIAELEAAK